MNLKKVICLAALGCAAANPSADDLKRAKTWKPRSGYRGKGTLASANAQLNKHLSKTTGLRLKSCEEFAVEELKELLRTLHPMSSEELKAIYSKVDGRRALYETIQDMENHWASVSSSDLRVRDGLCHEAVMWFVHHLTEDAKREAMLKLTLPKLPVADHTAKSRDEGDAAGKFYDEKVTCQRCHVNGIESLGAPEIKPTTDKQLARRCYTNYQDLFNVTCGPCDGVAGKYWGDDDDKFFNPDECVVVGTPEDIPENERVKAHFPQQFSVDIVAGSDRWGRTTNPAVSPKTGLPTFMNSLYGQISGHWYMDVTPESDLWLLRHDTHYGDVTLNGTKVPFAKFDVSEIHSQTREQQKTNSTGPMVSLVKGLPTIFPGACTCVPDPVGLVDTTGTRLPGIDQMKYLGRIKLTLSEYDHSVVELDHWALWFFHVFMEVDPKSQAYGKAPRRLASAYAGTAIYENWVLDDPKKADPTVWYRGIPTSPMKVGPDHGKFCLNPKKIADCNNISQSTFPPKPQAQSDKREINWQHIHDNFLPKMAGLEEHLAKMMANNGQVFV